MREGLARERARRQPAIAPAARATPGRTLLLTGTAGFLVSLNLLVVAVAFPAIQASFAGSSRSQLSWILNGHNIVYGSLLVPAGQAADRWGRRRVFLLGLTAFAAGSLLCSVAASVPALVGGRVVQGVGSALLTPSSLGLLLAAFPLARRAQAVAAWSAISTVGGALGPTVGAAVVQAAQWRAVFVLYLPVAVMIAAFGVRSLDESRQPARAGRPDWLGVLLLTFGLGALALGLVEGREWGWRDGRVIGAFAAAAVLLPAFLLRSAHHPEPVLDLSLFRIKSFAVANAASLVFAVAFFGQVFLAILFLTSVWGYSILAAALALTPSPALAALVAVPAGRLAARYGFAVVSVAGTLCYMAGMLWFALVTGHRPDYLVAWLPGTLLTGVGIGANLPILGAASVSAIPQARYAVAGAVNLTARQVGAVLGVALGVAMVGPAALATALPAFHRFWVLGAGLSAGSALLCLMLRPWSGRRSPTASGR
jgi:EmrB/QacA subfamily drug resistance transporter